MAHLRAGRSRHQSGGRRRVRGLRRGAGGGQALSEPAPDALTRATLLEAVTRLGRRDGRLSAIVRLHGTPPLWSRPRGFPTLLRIILEQQVSLASARALYRRLAGTGEPTPDLVLALHENGLRRLGFTRQKARYAVELAARVRDGRLPLARLHLLSDEAAGARLREVPGIGPWTASIYLLMALRRPDVWPPGDLALHKAIARLDGRSAIPATAEATALAERWRPLRAVAARILWHGYLADRRRSAVH